MFNMNFAKFGHDFSLAMACTMGNNVRYKVGADIRTGGEWRSQLARSQGWDGTDDHFWSPKAIYKYAQQWSFAMRKRKEAIYNATVKLKTVKDIVNKLKVKTIIFCETADFANKVTKELGDIARVYHTKIESEIRTVKKERVTKTKGTIITYVEKKVSGNIIKKENLEAFTNTEEILVLVTVRSLDEGFDFSKIALGIMASYNSSKRQDTQRTGRTVRKDEDNPDKCSLVVNLYIKDTQEEKWLKAKQLGKRGIIEIDSIDAISVEGNILEGSIKLT